MSLAALQNYKKLALDMIIRAIFGFMLIGSAASFAE